MRRLVERLCDDEPVGCGFDAVLDEEWGVFLMCAHAVVCV